MMTFGDGKPMLGGNSEHCYSVVFGYKQDAWVAVKACEGLMLCASLPEPTAAACVVECTPFCSFLAGRLVTLYDTLPPGITPALVDSVDAKWG